MNWLQGDRGEGGRQDRSASQPPEDELRHPGNPAQWRGPRARLPQLPCRHHALPCPLRRPFLGLALGLLHPHPPSRLLLTLQNPACCCPLQESALRVLTPHPEGTHRALCPFPGGLSLRWTTAGQSQLPPCGQGPAHNPLSSMLKPSAGCKLYFCSCNDCRTLRALEGTVATGRAQTPEARRTYWLSLEKAGYGVGEKVLHHG